jgi:hypothetical protein
MDAEKRENFVRSLNLYIDICADRALWGTHEGDLVDKAEAAKDAGAEAAQSNVARLNGGIKKLEPEDDAGPSAPYKTGHTFGQPRDGMPLGDGADALGDYDATRLNGELG